MAATNYTPIYLYNSGTTTNVPLAANLGNGELAINYYDGKLFYKDNTGTVQVIATKTSASITLPVSPSNGGTGVSNNSASTITISGNYGTTFTVTGTTAVTLPTSGTLVNTAVTTLSSLVSVGTITTGTWNASVIGPAYGGTGVANNAASTITISGNYASTFVVSGAYSYTFPAATDTLVNLGSSQTLTNKTLTNPTITAYLETAPAIANSSTAVTLSLSSGTVLSYTLTGNCTFTMPTATSGTSFILKLIQDGTGSRTATFTGVKWPAGTAPTITTTASTGLDILSFVCINSVWYGTYAQAFA